LPIDESIFGITEDYKIHLHKEIFDFVYMSEGRFSHTEIYNMPITLRRLNLSFLSKILYERQEAMKRRK
jgi:hypothetical protein